MTCPEVNACPMCKKVVEYGLVCECCSSWFHATEGCCGDALKNAFVKSGRDVWCCINCFPTQGDVQPPDPYNLPIAAIDHLDWRRAFRILSDACAGCGLKVGEACEALRCAQCDLAFHATERCTGVGTAELQARVDDPEWRCPTCMVHATGGAMAGALVLEDVTAGQEDKPIPALNECDGENTLQRAACGGDFEYVRQVAWRHPNVLEQRSTVPLADWGGRCIHEEAASWMPATRESGGAPIKRESGVGGSAYNSEGCLLFARDHIFECNGSSSKEGAQEAARAAGKSEDEVEAAGGAGCGPDCPNRVVGRGVWAPLQVVKTIGRGWGVRSRVKLPAGSFVCEYTGNILLDTDADTAGLEQVNFYI